MTWYLSFNSVVWPSIGTVLLLLVLSTYGWLRRKTPGAMMFAISGWLAILWVVGSIMEYVPLDVGAKIFWVKFQAVFQLPAITAVTCFLLDYTWPGRLLTRRNLGNLSIGPLLYLGLALTNDLHHLMWLGFTANGPMIDEQVGLAYWPFLIYAYGLGLLQVTTYVWLLRHSPHKRWPVILMLAGHLGTRTIYLLVRFAGMHSSLPLETGLIAYLYLMFTIALFGFRLFNPITQARQIALAQMHEGMLVLDEQKRVVSLNPAAQAILGLSEKHALHRPVQEVLPGEINDGEIRLGSRAEMRDYLLTVSSLKDWRGQETGRLLLLRDITEQKRAQAQLMEQQRAMAMLHEREQLARELHDSLGQVFAFINTQGQTASRLLERGDLATANSYIGRLVEVARAADVDIRESILGLRVNRTDQRLIPALKQYLAQYEKNYGIHTELQQPEMLPDGLLEPLAEVQLLRILQEALTNVRKHACAGSVQMVFARENGCLRVTVRDNGQGFDPGAGDPANGHVGLRVMHERAEEVGGSLWVESVPGAGTQVVVEVPVRENIEIEHA